MKRTAVFEISSTSAPLPERFLFPLANSLPHAIPRPPSDTRFSARLSSIIKTLHKHFGTLLPVSWDCLNARLALFRASIVVYRRTWRFCVL